MNLIRKGHRHAHRGVIGIESAIVLIAFVIVAAALAFVVLNMGFATSQKAKTSIIAALGEAGSSLTISGKVIGSSNGATPLNAVMIPLKITSGGDSVDLATTRATVSYLGESVEYDNIYDTNCLIAGAGETVHANATTAWTRAVALTCISASPITGAPTATQAIIYWAVSNQAVPNSILEPGEHAMLSIGWDGTGAIQDRPNDLDKIKIELAVTGGATLTVERTIPNITSEIVDLG
jgi:flagellin FlaB